MPGNSWCHKGKRGQLGSPSGYGEDILRKAGLQQKVCRSPLHRLEEDEKDKKGHVTSTLFAVQIQSSDAVRFTASGHRLSPQLGFLSVSQISLCI